MTTSERRSRARRSSLAPLAAASVSSAEPPRSRKKSVYGDVAGMALPLLLVSLSSPILSMIDVAAVGRTAGVVELASLGPATSVCDLSMYVFNTLSVVTTRLAAAALVDGDEAAAAARVRDGLCVAVAVGGLWACVLLSPLARAMLAVFLPTGGDPAVLACALSYARIRAPGFVAALGCVVLQSSALVRRDVALPLFAVWVGAAANALGDYALVARLGWGVSGAAAATVVAQFVAAAVLLRAERRATAGRPLAPPARADVVAFLRLCAAPAIALLGRLSIVLTVSATASACGTVALAANQVLSGTFQLFRPMGDALGQTMQTLLPAVVKNNEDSLDSMSGIADGGETLSRRALAVLGAMCGGAVALGAIDALLGGAVGLVPQLFTDDVRVMAAISATAPLIGATLLVHALSVTLEGVLFATGDAAAVAKIYGLNAVVVSLAFAKLRAAGPTLPRVWGGFLLYNVARVVQFSGRFLWTQREAFGVRRKRELPSLFLDLSTGAAASPAAEPVWSTDYSYEARKYSAGSYDV